MPRAILPVNRPGTDPELLMEAVICKFAPTLVNAKTLPPDSQMENKPRPKKFIKCNPRNDG
jgi:hypothetical protein